MNFHKSKIAQAVGAVIAATAASQALAVDVSNYNEATQVTLYVSGATATEPGLVRLFELNNANNGICADGTVDVYVSADNAKRLILCTGRSTGSPALPLSLQGTRIAIHKSGQGGSGNGVGALVRNLAATDPANSPDFWNVPTGGGFLAGCAGVTTNPPSSSFATFVNHAACANTPIQERVPDASLTDLEPAMFRTVFTPNINAAELAAIPAGPISAVGFGIPVTLKVRNNMQRILFPTSSVCHPSNAAYAANAETEACAPSLTKAQLAALYSQSYFDWTFLVGSGGSVANPDGTVPNQLANSGEVFICRRVATSGTQAVFETQLMGQRCVSGVPTFASASSDIFGSGDPHVAEGSGSGNVVSCLTAHNTAGRGAIGVLSLEFAPTIGGTDSGYRFIKINGAAPCLLNIVQSKYDFLGESTMQWRTANINGLTPLGGTALTLAGEARSRIGAPAVVNDLNTAFAHPMCSAQGTGVIVGNAQVNSATAPVPPFVVGGGSTSDVLLHPVLTKTRGLNGANSCGPMLDVLPTQVVN